MQDSRFNVRGFTLIELSLIIVVSGLIIGGILVGRDLITAAQVRQTGKRIEELNAATLTFRAKYNCLPGDCKNASDFLANLSGTANGNGDGDITEPGYVGVGCGGRYNSGYENFNFLQHLISSNLINDNRPCTAKGTCTPSCFLDSMGMKLPLPDSGGYLTLASLSMSKDTSGSGWTAPVYVLPANHAYLFSKWTPVAMPSVSPAFVRGLDQKFDDGLPLSGIITATGMSDQYVIDDQHFGTTTLGCMDHSVPAPYIYKTTSNSPDCTFMWQTPF